MKRTVPYIAGIVLALVIAVFACETNGRARLRTGNSPSRLRGGSEKDNRSIGELDLEKLYPGLVLRTYKGLDKIMALTFDDGPDRQFTPQILDVLKSKDVKATFFLIGKRVEEDPEIAKRIAAEGHAVGNHTYSHPKLTAASPALPRELARAKEAMAKVGLSDNGLFRPPYGAAEPSLIEQAASLGYRVAMWSVDSLDWRGLSRAEVVRNIEGYAGLGAVILQHSAGGPGEDLSGSVLATGDIIDSFRAKGYRFVTMAEMFPDPKNDP